MLALDCVVEEAKFGRAQFDCQTFTETILLPDLTTDDGQYVSYIVHTSPSLMSRIGAGLCDSIYLLLD